jgi:hypothetical protein
MQCTRDEGKRFLDMGNKKKNKMLGPKRKRMNRKGRLQSGKEWIKTYEGNNIIKSYANWYGVNKLCAMVELEMLGLQFSDKKKEQIRREEAGKARQNQLRKEKRKKKEQLESFDYDSDEVFSFIAGYTEGGIPFGITHEEMEEEYTGYDMDFLESSNDDPEFDDEEWEEPTEEEWVEYLLDKKQMTPIKWENEKWYSESFDWERYFGHTSSEENQEQFVYELNRLDLLKTIRGNRNRL